MFNLKQTKLGLLLLLVSFGVHAAKVEEKPLETNKKMVQIGKDLEEIAPLFLNFKEFEKKPNLAKVLKNIKDIKSTLSSLDGHLSQSDLSYKISKDVFLDHLDSSISTLEKGYTMYGFEMVRSIPNFCINCHTNDGRSKTLYKNQDRKQFNSDFDYAEYSHMTRNLDEAIKYYDLALNQKKEMNSLIQQKILDRLLSIEIVSNFDADKIKSNINKNLENKNIPPFVKEDAKEWIKAIDAWKNLDLSGKEKPIQEQIDKTMTKIDDQESFIAEGKDRVAYLYIFREIQKRLSSTADKKELPILLYNLSLVDRKLNDNFFFSMADLYLKECMKNYADEPIAKKCFQEYRNYIIFSFSGSGGTDIPEDIMKDLRDYKAKIFR